MKFCPQCGAQNKDEAKFCVDCGADISNIAAAQPKGNATPQQTPQSTGQKNKWIPAILNIIGGMILYGFCGIGHALYLRLYNRAAIFAAIGFLLSAISTAIAIFNDSYTLTVFTTAIGIGVTIYAAYDAYKCSQAINEGRELPALWGGFRPESLSRGKAFGACVICLVLLVIAFVAFMSTPMVSESSTMGIGDDIISDDIITDADDTSASKNDDSGVQIKISYPGEWSASVGDQDTTTSYKGTGDDVINVDDSKYDVIAAAVQKTDGSSDKLKVKIIKDGDTLDSESTTEDFGVVTVSATI